ncbi:MAG TPA: hypothetical protein VGR54_07035 [Nitrosopumilaceae archaeon]|nr:hypothetical protein [Nitrosopumilaceae archaeon]
MFQSKLLMACLVILLITSVYAQSESGIAYAIKKGNYHLTESKQKITESLKKHDTTDQQKIRVKK